MSAMTLPGRAAMTTTRSERYTASSIWWVTKRTVFFAAFQIPSSSACISSRVCASSAAKGPSWMSRSTFSIARSVFPGPRSRYCICTPRAERARCPLLTSRDLVQVQARTPALQIPLCDADGFGQNNAEHGEDQDAEEHPVALQRGFGPRDHHAKTRGLRVELGDDHAREDAADREPDAAHDEGQRSRDHEGREDEPLRRAEASRDVEELAIAGPYAFDRGQDDREEPPEEHDDRLHLEAQAHPENDEGDKGNPRESVEEVQPRVERQGNAAVPPDRDAERHGKQQRRERSDRKLGRADLHVLPEARLLDLQRAGGGDLDRRAEEELRDQASVR